MAVSKTTKAKTVKAKPKAAPRGDAPPGVAMLLTYSEVSNALGVSVRKLRQMIATGLFPKSRGPAGMDPRWTADDVNGWIKSHYHQGGVA